MRSHRIGLRLWGIAELPFWPARNGSMQLADLGVLEVADLGREALQGPAGDRDRREERRVPVALDDLGAHRVDVEAERAEHLRLEVRVEVAVRADRPGDLAGRRCRRRPSPGGAGRGRPRTPSRRA